MKKRKKNTDKMWIQEDKRSKIERRDQICQRTEGDRGKENWNIEKKKKGKTVTKRGKSNQEKVKDQE